MLQGMFLYNGEVVLLWGQGLAGGSRPLGLEPRSGTGGSQTKEVTINRKAGFWDIVDRGTVILWYFSSFLLQR